MTRRKKTFPILENIKITDVAAEGKSLVRIGDPPMVVFVPWCVPGDVVDLQIKRKKHNYAEAEVVRFKEYSPTRIQPRCSHFGVCGGCKWQNLPYDEQILFKQKQVFDQLTRIGHLSLPLPGSFSEDGRLEFRPILGSVKQYEYRNKLDFGASNKRYLTREELQAIENNDGKDFLAAKNVPALGFHITGAFDKILPIKKCHLMDNLHNEIRNDILSYAISKGLSFFDLREQVGLIRDVIIRNSNSGEWMLILQVHLDHSTSELLKETEEQVVELLQHIADTFPQITSLMWIDNQKCNDTYGDLPVKVFRGNDHIIEHMEDLRFKVGPKSFYQTNTDQAYHLYSVVRELAFRNRNIEDKALTDTVKPLVYDLYTGTGTIANFVAQSASMVIGIEYVPEAIEDAKVNSQLNNIRNTLFYAGDMKDVLNDDFIAKHGSPDVIITDPPRAGMHPDVVKTILRTAPHRIVYVSCNPATQARDLELLSDDYELRVIQPVDMFPHTPHVENVVLLEKKWKEC